MCIWYEEGTGSCFLNGSPCYIPWSQFGCEVQWHNIFKQDSGIVHYESSGLPRIIYTKDDIYNKLNINKDDLVADQFCPYSLVLTDLPNEIEYGYKVVKRKFNGLEPSLYIYHNVQILDEIGFYIIGVVKEGKE